MKELVLKKAPRPLTINEKKDGSSFVIRHEVKGEVTFAPFTKPTRETYPFLGFANNALERIQETSKIKDPDKVSDSDYEFLKNQKDLFEKGFINEKGMQYASRNKAEEALRLISDELERLTPEPVQWYKRK